MSRGSWSPLGVHARVAGARHPGGYMCRVPGSTDSPRSSPMGSFQVPDGTPPRPPGIAGIIILSRRPARQSRPRIRYVPRSIPRSIAGLSNGDLSLIVSDSVTSDNNRQLILIEITKHESTFREHESESHILKFFSIAS